MTKGAADGRKKKERVENDNYPTDPRLCRAIVSRLAQVMGEPAVVVEPSAGEGPFVMAARAQWPDADIIAIELRDCTKALYAAGADEVIHGRWEDDFPQLDAKSLILGNPPYGLGPDHVELALNRLAGADEGWLCFLMRQSFLSSQKRYERFYSPTGLGGVRYVWHIAERPSFTGDGQTDNAEYVAIVWQARYRGPYEGDWLSWR